MFSVISRLRGQQTRPRGQSSWYDSSCLVPRPHFSSRPKRFGSRGPCENVFPARSSWIRHRNELTERDWENTVQGLGNDSSMSALADQEEQVEIPSEKLGLVIGRQGRRLKECGVQIFIKDNLAHLRGTAEQVQRAKNPEYGEHYENKNMNFIH